MFILSCFRVNYQLSVSRLCMQMFAEALLEPEHLPDPAASLQDVPVSLTHGAAAMQWELQHLTESLAAAKQQEADTMQRVRDTERQLASLQTALAEQHKQHERQSAQLSNEADAKVQLVKVLQEQAFELQRRLTAQRQQLQGNEAQLKDQQQSLQQLCAAKEEEEHHLHRLQAGLWQEASRQSLDEAPPAEVPSAGLDYKSTTELKSNARQTLQAAYTRVKGQYQAAAKRIAELEVLQQVAMTAAHEHQLAMHQKQAELVTAKQSVRSAVADHMRSMSASASQVAKYDDLIEEASGELEQVESEVHGATQQLLDLQGRVRQLAHHTQAAEKTLQKKEEEVRGMQAELHSVLTGVRAARHEQQEEHWKIAQLKHQHEDTLQAETHVRNQMAEVQAELQALKASRQRHAEQQKDQDQMMIRLNRESEAAASCQKQACEELKTVQSDLKAAQEELQHKQCIAETLRAKVADSQLELSSLQRTLHALHAEVATAQQAHDEVSAQLSEAQLQLEGRQMQFIRLSQDQDASSQDELDDQQIVSDLVRHMGSGHPQVPKEAVSPSQHQQARSSVAGSVSNEGQQENLQEGKGSPAGTCIESSGSNQAGVRFHDLPSMQTTHAEQLLLLPSTADPSACIDAGLDRAAADEQQQQLQKVAHLKARLREEVNRRQQAEQQLLQMQHGPLPSTSHQGSPLSQESAKGSPLPQGSPKGSQLPQGSQLLQGSPLPQGSAKGSPLPQGSAKGSPLSQGSPKGSPLPQGSPLPAHSHQIPDSAELPETDRHSQQRLHRRLQRLQDERIHLEGLLAHERSLLAQQQSDNANLRSLLAQQQTHTPAADGRQVVTHQHNGSRYSDQNHHQAHVHVSDARQHAAQQQSDSKHNVQFDDFAVSQVGEGARDWETQAMQLQAELRLLQSQHDALRSELAEQRAASSHVRQQLKQAVMSRTDVSAWEAHAVQMEAEHEVVTSELHAVKEQLRTYIMQVADLEAFKGKLADEGLMRKQQAEYLQGRMETCQRELSKLEVQQTVLASCLRGCIYTTSLQEPPATCVC
ncbi:TPA: hypothetical protein ACH3X3_012736 [Trebouxia sp. C0006]